MDRARKTRAPRSWRRTIKSTVSTLVDAAAKPPYNRFRAIPLLSRRSGTYEGPDNARVAFAVHLARQKTPQPAISQPPLCLINRP